MQTYNEYLFAYNFSSRVCLLCGINGMILDRRYNGANIVSESNYEINY